MMRVGKEEFEELVRRALDDLPVELAELMENMALVIDEEPAAELLAEMGLHPTKDELFGLYEGVPLSERGSSYEALPDRIIIFSGPLLRYCRSRRQLMREVRDTVVHEIGHHFGLEEEEMPF